MNSLNDDLDKENGTAFLEWASKRNQTFPYESKLKSQTKRKKSQQNQRATKKKLVIEKISNVKVNKEQIKDVLANKEQITNELVNNISKLNLDNIDLSVRNKKQLKTTNLNSKLNSSQDKKTHGEANSKNSNELKLSREDYYAKVFEEEVIKNKLENSSFAKELLPNYKELSENDWDVIFSQSWGSKKLMNFSIKDYGSKLSQAKVTVGTLDVGVYKQNKQSNLSNFKLSPEQTVHLKNEERYPEDFSLSMKQKVHDLGLDLILPIYKNSRQKNNYRASFKNFVDKFIMNINNHDQYEAKKRKLFITLTFNTTQDDLYYDFIHKDEAFCEKLNCHKKKNKHKYYKIPIFFAKHLNNFRKQRAEIAKKTSWQKKADFNKLFLEFKIKNSLEIDGTTKTSLKDLTPDERKAFSSLYYDKLHKKFGVMDFFQFFRSKVIEVLKPDYFKWALTPELHNCMVKEHWPNGKSKCKCKLKCKDGCKLFPHIPGDSECNKVWHLHLVVTDFLPPHKCNLEKGNCQDCRAYLAHLWPYGLAQITTPRRIGLTNTNRLMNYLSKYLTKNLAFRHESPQEALKYGLNRYTNCYAFARNFIDFEGNKIMTSKPISYSVSFTVDDNMDHRSRFKNLSILKTQLQSKKPVVNDSDLNERTVELSNNLITFDEETKPLFTTLLVRLLKICDLHNIRAYYYWLGCNVSADPYAYKCSIKEVQWHTERLQKLFFIYNSKSSYKKFQQEIVPLFAKIEKERGFLSYKKWLELKTLEAETNNHPFLQDEFKTYEAITYLNRKYKFDCPYNSDKEEWKKRVDTKNVYNAVYIAKMVAFLNDDNSFQEQIDNWRQYSLRSTDDKVEYAKKRGEENRKLMATSMPGLLRGQEEDLIHFKWEIEKYDEGMATCLCTVIPGWQRDPYDFYWKCFANSGYECLSYKLLKDFIKQNELATQACINVSYKIPSSLKDEIEFYRSHSKAELVQKGVHKPRTCPLSKYRSDKVETNFQVEPIPSEYFASNKVDEEAKRLQELDKMYERGIDKLQKIRTERLQNALEELEKSKLEELLKDDEYYQTYPQERPENWKPLKLFVKFEDKPCYCPPGLEGGTHALKCKENRYEPYVDCCCMDYNPNIDELVAYRSRKRKEAIALNNLKEDITLECLDILAAEEGLKYENVDGKWILTSIEKDFMTPAQKQYHSQVKIAEEGLKFISDCYCPPNRHHLSYRCRKWVTYGKEDCCCILRAGHCHCLRPDQPHRCQGLLGLPLIDKVCECPLENWEEYWMAFWAEEDRQYNNAGDIPEKDEEDT